MSSTQRWPRRREEGSRTPRRPTESIGAERHHRRGNERRLRPGACSAASRKRPSSLLGVLGVYSSRAYLLTWLVGMVGMGRGGRVSAQYQDGGKVSMDCGDCSCSGSSDDGTIEVFQSPSSGDMVASVNGGYSEVLETSCGSSIIAVGDNLYELSGVEFIERELDVIDMSSAECAGVDIKDPADCYSGESSSSLDDGIELSVTICYCKHVDGSSTSYRSNVGTTVKGATSITVPGDEVHICFDFDYVSQMTAFVVSGSTYYYDFELAIPGEDTSADLSVASAPPSSAEAFMCGEAEVEPTPSPVDPTPPTPEPTPPPVPEPTPAPEKPTPPPVDPTTPAPTAVTPSPVAPEPTAPPQPPPTSAPEPPPTPGPVVPEPEPTSAPVAPEPEPTLAPTKAVDPTSAPVTPVPVPDLTPAPVAPPTPALTDAPVKARTAPEPTLEPTRAVVTPKPSVAPESLGPTTAPVAPPVASASPAPSVASNTSRPAGTGATLGPLPVPTATPLAVPLTGAPTDPAKPSLGPTTTSPAPSTGASSSSERTVGGGTAAPATSSDGEGHECDLPLDSSCTQNTGFGNLNKGIGMFYDPVCNTTATAEEKEPGCQGNSEVCRLCLFNTTRYLESNPGEDLPNFAVCPCCVWSTYTPEAAGDADSSICGTASPAPSAGTTPSPAAFGSTERASIAQSFQDRSLRVGGGNGVAVAALGLLSVLTFLPACSK